MFACWIDHPFISWLIILWPSCWCRRISHVLWMADSCCPGWTEYMFVTGTQPIRCPCLGISIGTKAHHVVENRKSHPSYSDSAKSIVQCYVASTPFVPGPQPLLIPWLLYSGVPLISVVSTEHFSSISFASISQNHFLVSQPKAFMHAATRPSQQSMNGHHTQEETSLLLM